MCISTKKVNEIVVKTVYSIRFGISVEQIVLML